MAWEVIHPLSIPPRASRHKMSTVMLIGTLVGATYGAVSSGKQMIERRSGVPTSHAVAYVLGSTGVGAAFGFMGGLLLTPQGRQNVRRNRSFVNAKPPLIKHRKPIDRVIGYKMWSGSWKAPRTEVHRMGQSNPRK